MSTGLFNLIESESVFTKAECSAFSAKQLRQLAQYDPGRTIIPEPLVRFVNGRSIQAVDRTFFFDTR